MYQTRTAVNNRAFKAIDHTIIRVLLISVSVALVITFLTEWISPENLTEVIDADFANLFLATVAQIFGGALAIVFSVSALVITMIADRYTHQLVSKFATDPLTIITFLTLLICTLVAIISIGVSMPMYKWGFLGMVFFVSFGLGLLMQHLLHALHLIKPSTMSDLLSLDGLKALEKQGDNGFFKVLSSMGDVVFKAIERGEEDIAEYYLRALHKIHLGWIANDRKPVGDDRWLVALGIERRSPVLNQYKRIFKVLMNKNDEILARLIENLVVESVYSLIERENESLTLTGLLTQHRELAELAIKHHNSSRFGFVHSYRDLIRHTGKLKKDCLGNCLKGFVEICKEIIVQDDQELWNDTLNFFCIGSSSINELFTSLRNVYSRLDHSLDHQNSWQNIVMVVLDGIMPHLTPNKQKLLMLSLNGLSNSLNSEHTAQVQIKQINQLLTDIDVTTHFIDAFFQIGIEALALEKHQYIKSLYQPSNSQTRIERVPADLGFAILQTIFWIRNSKFIFFEPEKLSIVPRYCFLNFAYALHRSAQHQWSPIIPDYSNMALARDNEFSEAVSQDLRDLYCLLTNFEYAIKPILEQYDSLANNYTDWNDLFDGNGIQAFKNAYAWLLDKNRQEQWSKEASRLVERLPISVTRENQYFANLRQGYKNGNRVHQLATYRPPSMNNGVQTRLNVRVHCDKVHFTILGDHQPNHDCVFQAQSLGVTLVRQEEDFIIQTILSNENIHVIETERLTFATLVASVEQICSNEFQPTVLITSNKQFTDALDNDQDFRNHVQSINGQTRILINESIRLLAIFRDINSALVLTPKSGRWSRIEQNHSITVCPNDPLKLHLNMEETVKYQLVNENGVVILRFKSTLTKG